MILTPTVYTKAKHIKKACPVNHTFRSFFSITFLLRLIELPHTSPFVGLPLFGHLSRQAFSHKARSLLTTLGIKWVTHPNILFPLEEINDNMDECWLSKWCSNLFKNIPLYCQRKSKHSCAGTWREITHWSLFNMFLSFFPSVYFFLRIPTSRRNFYPWKIKWFKEFASHWKRSQETKHSHQNISA